jgi:hypothetical protein
LTDQTIPESEHPLDFLPELALGVLAEDEAPAIREHLAGCPSCQAEYATMSQAARMLPFAAEETEPNPKLREGLMQRIASEPRLMRPRSGTTAWPAWQRFASIAAAAAVLVVAGAFAGAQLWGGNDEDLEAENERSGAFVQAIAQGNARRDTAESGASKAMVVYVPGHTSAFAWLEGMPALPSGKAYQAWFIADGAPRPSTVFSQPSGGVWLESPEDVAKFGSIGLTIEDEDGANAPSQAPFMVVELNRSAASKPFSLQDWFALSLPD